VVSRKSVIMTDRIVVAMVVSKVVTLSLPKIATSAAVIAERSAYKNHMI
jgi:hypothetical protein